MQIGSWVVKLHLFEKQKKKSATQSHTRKATESQAKVSGVIVSTSCSNGGARIPPEKLELSTCCGAVAWTLRKSCVVSSGVAAVKQTPFL